MNGDPETQYVLARRTLLDALEFLGVHRGSVILVGAQAIYLHTGESDVAVAPFTRDADLALDPRGLDPEPKIETILREHGYEPREHQIGVWRNPFSGGQVDFLVPEALSGAPGRRAAQLPTQGNRLARRTTGLEGVIVENERRMISAMEPGDTRRFEIRVAGPAALLAAKLFKIDERRVNERRLVDKDAIDVLRLLRAVPTETLRGGMERLRSDPLTRDVSDAAINQLQRLFGHPDGEGVAMAVRGLDPLEPADEIRASTPLLAKDLVAALKRSR